MNEHRFWRPAYWVGRVDARPLALLRIGLGAVLLWDLVTWIPTIRPFLTDDGILPRGVQRGPSWGLFELAGGYPLVAAIFALGFAATIAFTLGWRTRVMTGAVWLFYVSLLHRNVRLADGGDSIARMLLFWGMFTNLGGVWSLDARAGRREPAVPALGAHLIMLQLAALYLGTAFLKVRGDWLHHNMIYQVMQLDGFVRPPGRWLLDHPSLCQLMTDATLVMELAVPILIVSPFMTTRTHLAAIATATALQLGILVTMRVGTFTGVMLVSSLVLVPPALIDRVLAWRGRPGSAPAAPPPRTPSTAYVALAVAAALQLCASVLEAAYRVPAPVEREVVWTGLTDGIDLLSVDLPVPSWYAPGTFDDGTTIDVLPIAAPEMQPTDGYLFSRWTKLRFRAPEPEPLAHYLCREVAAHEPDRKLVSLVIEMHSRPPRTPDDDGAPPERVERLWAGRCP